MAEQGLLKAFIEVTKGVQEQRDCQKIAELEQTIQTLHLRQDQLERSQSLMKESYESQLRELRGHNIRLDSENRTFKMKTSMLERIMEEDQRRSSKQDPSQLAAFRILTEENKHLKALLKQHIGETP